MSTTYPYLLHRAVLAAMGATFLVGCGGDGSGPDGPPDPVLTTLAVTPSLAAIFNTAPGNTVALTVTGKDQNGLNMPGLGAPSFASSNNGVATVSPTGVVTAVAAGTAQITASLQSVTGTASVTVKVPPFIADVSSTGIPLPAFVPASVHLSSGGDVAWTFGPVAHTVTFQTQGSPANVPVLADGSATRNFPNPGSFSYKCDIHPTMVGTVFVH